MVTKPTHIEGGDVDVVLMLRLCTLMEVMKMICWSNRFLTWCVVRRSI